jgi:medium-chain acyl-[acyl-carrier-protein] hydrolase
MRNVTERIAALSPDQQAMLLQRLKPNSHHLIANQLRAPSVLEDRYPSPADAWIVRYRPNAQARLRLFCFSYAGGGASVFRPWLDLLPPEVEICGIQLPGREHRLAEPAYRRIGPLVQAAAGALYPYLDRPFAFYGHSMGALVSFELARQLRRTHDRHPIRLFLAAYRAPQLPNPHIKIYHLPSEVFKVVLRADGIPERILQNEELMQAMLPTLRADFELCDTYTYKEEPPLDCPFSIFGGLEDVRVRATDLEGWHIHSNVSCSLSLLAGSHFFIHSAQDLLLAAICQDLEAHLGVGGTDARKKFAKVNNV